MARVTDFIAVALADLGYKESPAGSNHTKYGEFMGLQNQPWCMSAIQYWANRAGVQLPAKTGSCKTLMNAAKNANQWVTSDYKPGDIFIYQWKDGSRHCGILHTIVGNVTLTIEGNTAIGNESNGGEVMVRQRTLEFVLGAVRPQFDTAEDTSEYDQFKQFMEQYRAELKDNDAHSYSAEARAWAADCGIILGNGTTPEGQPNFMWGDFTTREQFVTMLYRYDEYLSSHGH